MATGQDHDHLFKILVLGESTVGKSSLLLRFVDNTFSTEFMATVGIDFKFKTLLVRDKLVKLQIWDTAGQERFKSITYGFFRGAHGIVLAFDVTSMNTFTKIQNWLSDIQKHADSGIPVVLVGNKTDLGDNREVLTETAKVFADEHKLPYVETSAKTGNGVEKAFSTLVAQILEHKQNTAASDEKGKVKVGGNGSATGGGCC